MRLTIVRAGALHVVATLVVTILAMAYSPEAAFSLCAEQQEDGNWKNADPQTRGITRIKLMFNCQDMILNGEPYPPGPPWKVHLYGACHPTDCDWGEADAKRLGSDHIYAFYNQGYAKRYVYAKMSIYRPGQLWVWIWTDFTDPNRPDYGMHNWFVPE